LPVASAQIKSCLLLAGLYASGRTCVREPQKSRDHTERMLPIFGAHVEQPCCVSGGVKLIAADLKVPGDISSAAFFLAAAAMVPDSDVVLRNVGLNPTRDGILRVLQAMGADIDIGNHRVYGAEPVGDIRVRYSRSIEGISIPEEWVPSLIDELPVIMAMAAVTPGTTRIRGATELRVKESDRLSVMAQGLAGLGVRLQEYEDGIDITGGAVQGGEADGVGDHRCAMSFGILGQVAEGPLLVRGARQIDTSYPAFAQHLRALGGSVEARAVSPPA
jgi:3-phosphoshikimate 1-carboxyvinyltransferase